MKIYTKTDSGKELILDTYSKEEINSLIRQLVDLFPYVPPTLEITSDPNIICKGETLDSFTLTFKITPSYRKITNISLYYGDNLIKDDFDITATNISYTYTGDIVDDTMFILKVTDDTGRITTASLFLDFVYPSYYGFVDDANFDINNDLDLTSFTKDYSPNKYLEWKTINCVNKIIMYVYPAEYGILHTIIDTNNFNLIDSFIRTEKTINGVDFIIYYTDDSCSLVNGELIFG